MIGKLSRCIDGSGSVNKQHITLIIIAYIQNIVIFFFNFQMKNCDFFLISAKIVGTVYNLFAVF